MHWILAPSACRVVRGGVVPFCWKPNICRVSIPSQVVLVRWISTGREHCSSLCPWSGGSNCVGIVSCRARGLVPCDMESLPLTASLSIVLTNHQQCLMCPFPFPFRSPPPPPPHVMVGLQLFWTPSGDIFAAAAAGDDELVLEVQPTGMFAKTVGLSDVFLVNRQ